MSDELTGYTEAAEVLDTRQERYEEASEIADELPENFRVVEISNGDGFHVERETEYTPKWVPIARFTDTDAQYEWADEIHGSTDGEYRCVVDKTDGDVWLEVLVEE